MRAATHLLEYRERQAFERLQDFERASDGSQMDGTRHAQLVNEWRDLWRELFRVRRVL